MLTLTSQHDDMSICDKQALLVSITPHLLRRHSSALFQHEHEPDVSQLTVQP